MFGVIAVNRLTNTERRYMCDYSTLLRSRSVMTDYLKLHKTTFCTITLELN